MRHDNIDTFLYDKSRKLIRNFTYDPSRQKIAHKFITRNDKGLAAKKNGEMVMTSGDSTVTGRLLKMSFIKQINIITTIKA